MAGATSIDGTRLALRACALDDPSSLLARSGGCTLEAHARDLAAVPAAVASPERRAVVVPHRLGGGILLAHAPASPTGGQPLAPAGQSSTVTSTTG